MPTRPSIEDLTCIQWQRSRVADIRSFVATFLRDGIQKGLHDTLSAFSEESSERRWPLPAAPAAGTSGQPPGPPAFHAGRPGSFGSFFSTPVVAGMENIEFCAWQSGIAAAALGIAAAIQRRWCPADDGARSGGAGGWSAERATSRPRWFKACQQAAVVG